MRKGRLQVIGICICSLVLTRVMQAQCTFDFGAVIDDLETITLQIHVDNLVNDDLSGNQGICAVELHFRHSYVGDLTVDLISPGGQMVQLVGAVTDQINPTNLTTWDVRFLQCGFPAAPDAGFSAQWSNNQPWQVFTTYTGSYYPAAGCLEDFNTGSANGIWQLRITDHDAPQTGLLLSVTLIFCDDTGLECNLCAADAGEFVPSDFLLCEGEEIAITPFYPDTIPDPQSYGHLFFLSNDDINTTFVAQVSTAPLSSGTYTICGISYSRADSAALFTTLDMMTFGEIRLAFLNGLIAECADITETCVTVEIDPLIDTTFLDMQVCSGSAVTVGGQSFSTPGIHIVNIDTESACDSIVVLDLEVITVEARVVQQDTISCTDAITMLDGSSSLAGPGATYAWNTQNGMILSAPNQPVITIDGPGIYRLVVTDVGCSDEILYDVIGDASFPFLFFEGGTLNCTNPTFTFNTVTYPLDVQFIWTGPGNFMSTEPEPTVSVPGMYDLIITDENGCSATLSAELLIDTAVDAAINLVRIECEYQRATLGASPFTQGTQYVWTTPTGMNTFNQETYATISGQYCVDVTATNGCRDSACFDYVADYTLPALNVMASTDTLHCGNQVQLVASSSVSNLIYQWNGPGGLLAGDSVILVSTPGQYIIVVTAPNACRNTDTATVYAGDDLLDFGTFTDTLDCNKDTVLIGVAILEPVLSYTWMGPGLVDTFDAYVRVTQPGNYTVEIISQTGCIQHASIAVTTDYRTVFYGLLYDTITCADPIANLTFTTSEDYEMVDWLLPDGTHSDQVMLNSTLPGHYSLTITGDNGCPRTLSVNLPVDTLPPVLFVEVEPLGCNDSVQIQTIRIDSIESYAWTGPGSFTSANASPFITTPGIYQLEATGVNGCASTFVQVVQSNMELPSIQVNAEELDCIDSVAILTIMSSDTAVTYAWYMGGVPIADSAIAVVSEPGEYIGSVTGPNGCVAWDTLDIMPPFVPLIFTETDTITCVEDAMLTASSDLPDVNFSWEDSDGMTGTGSQFTTIHAGQLLVTATGSNGCSKDTTIVIGVDTIPPVAIATQTEVILCNIQSTTLDATASLGQELNFSWVTPDGMIVSGADSAQPLIMGEGTYILQIIDASNGCTDTDTILVTEGESALGQIFLTVISECEGNGNGSITIDSVSGAASALSYTLNGEAGGPLFTQLSNGAYTLVVMDTFGCFIDSTVSLSNTSSMHSISLGEDQSILVGDSALLAALVDLDPSEILSVHWGQPVGCDSCLTNSVAPIHTAVYEVFLTDIFGCIASDAVTVFVEERPKYFVPNVFSPNGDEINDYVEISAHPGIERILQFTIYDRWGNAVFHATDFDPGDNSVRWDGTFGGKKLDPAVFVYIIEVKLLTGRAETNHGTVTLVK